MTDSPTLRILSLGAGVQSTALYLLACESPTLRFDMAIFADTGWEPRRVYEHLDRLEAHGREHDGPPIVRVSAGNIRDDALDADSRFASMPLFVRGPDGELGMARRQCTAEYKLKPIKQEVRRRLGYPHPTPVPRGVYAEMWIGISTDEVGRARDSDTKYMVNRHPLIDLGWSRSDCARYLRSIGWTSVAKSACVGCPFHGNAAWRTLRDTDPEGWADAVAFDEAIRHGSARALAQGQELRGEYFLHRSRVPLDQAPIDRVTRSEWKDRQGDILDAVADQLLEDGDPDGCGPWTCRSGEAVA